MPSADWLVPRLSLAAEAELEHSIRVLRREGPDNPETTVRIACDLMRQSVIHQALLRQAIAYVGGLEVELELAKRPAPRFRWRHWFSRANHQL